MKELSLEQILELVQGDALNPLEVDISGVHSLNEAQANQASFLANKKYAAQTAQTKAGIVFVPRDFKVPEENKTTCFIATDNPNAAFMMAVDFFAPPAIEFPPGIHPSAYVDPQATIGTDVHIGPNAVIQPQAIIGDGTSITAGCYIGHESKIGKNCLIYPNVSIRERCEIGDRVIIHSGTTVGSDGFGFIPGTQGHTKIAQVGNVVIEDDVEIGANCTIDRARFGSTTVGQGTKMDNLVQLAHNSKIGKHCFVVSQVGIAGSTNVGNFVTIAGQAGIGGHISIADGSTVMGQAGVTSSLHKKDTVIGSPAIPYKEFVAERLAVKKIKKLSQAVKELQRQIDELKG